MSKKTNGKRIIALLMATVLIVSQHAFLLDAYAADNGNLICGKTEHQHAAECYQIDGSIAYTCSLKSLGVHEHDDSCYDDEGALTCGYADFLIHEHDENCYDASGRLVCPLPEHPQHVHDASCYEARPILTCEEEETYHVHTSACYQEKSQLICGQNESSGHIHDDSCYTMVMTCGEDHEHTEACYERTLSCKIPEGTGAHTHTEDCYNTETVLVCGKAEAPEGHQHSTSCYDTEEVLICNEDELLPHVHTDECYSSGILGDGDLTCGMLEVLEHQHNADCIVVNDAGVSSEPLCGMEEHTHAEECWSSQEEETVYACGLDEHHHETSCYDEEGNLICELEEHTHDESCIPPENAVMLNTGRETVTVGGVEYNRDDFQQMSDYLISAYVISAGKTYDLMAGETIDSINIYKNIEVALNLKFQTSSTVVKLNKLYAWKMNGIIVEEETTGQLENSEGVVYGDYFINTDGTIYAVLNETGLQHTIIDWRLNFSALWKKTEGGEVIIDLGNGNSAKIDFDMTRGDITKNGMWRDSNKGTNVIWTSTIDAYDEISISKIEDYMYPASFVAKKISQYLQDNEKTSIADVLRYSDFTVIYTSPDGEEHNISIPMEDIVFEGGDLSDLQCKFTWIPETSIKIKAGTSAEFSYNVKIDEDLVNYCHLIDVDICRFDNKIDACLDNSEEKLSSSAFIQFKGENLIQKYVENDGKPDSHGTMSWNLVINKGNRAPITGAMVTDTLLTDIDYITEDSFYYYPKVDGSHSVGVLDIVKCATQEEFDAITTAPEGVSPVYIYGRSFKWFVPEMPETYSNYSLEFYYRTTINDALLKDYKSANKSVISIESDGPYDYGYDDSVKIKWEKENDGIHMTEDGRLYTNWSLVATINPNVDIEWFHIEEYMPHKSSRNLIDTIITTTPLKPGDSFETCDLQEARDMGFDITVTSFSGEDITEEIFGQFYVDAILSEDNPELYTISMGDASHKTDKGGFDARDEGYQIVITYAAYLEGDRDSFKDHKNSAVWYYTSGWSRMKATSIVNLPHIDNSELFSKQVIASEMSEDGATLTLTYDVRYNMKDILTGEGYKFQDKLDNTTYAKYRQGSLQVFWLKDPLSETPTRYSYHITNSPYYGEENLLKIDEDVSYRIDSKKNYSTFRMATLNQETDEGWTCTVPYYKRTKPGFSWYDPDAHDVFFYSPQFIYKVDIDIKAMEADGVYSLPVKNTTKSYLRDGTLDAVANSTYTYRGGVLQKSLTDVPVADNQYTATYELFVDATSPKIKDFQRIDVIDEMSSDMNLETDSIIVETSPDKENFDILPSSEYQLLYDGMAHRLTCAIDNTTSRNYYRITYNVQICGMAGSSINIHNRAYITGFKEQSTDVINTVVISNSSGSAEGATAKIIVKKYNADNLALSLSGAKFKLERAEVPSDEILQEINALETKEEIIAYLDKMDAGWTTIATDTTDSVGEIIWENGQDGIQLPLDTLFRLTEVSAPNGYVLDATPRYFYLSADGGATASRNGLFVSKFDVLNYESTVYIGNKKGAFSLRKIDSKTQDYLEGAKFGLYSSPDCSDDSLVAYSLDYGNGLYYFGDIGFNSTFYLKEVEAPELYEIDDTIYTVLVSISGGITISPTLTYNGSEYIFPDKPLFTTILPEAGGHGIIQIRGFAFMCVVAGIFLIFYAVTPEKYRGRRILRS